MMEYKIHGILQGTLMARNGLLNLMSYFETQETIEVNMGAEKLQDASHNTDSFRTALLANTSC